MIATDYIKWCLDHGLIVTKCYQFLCYRKCEPFRDFLNFVIENRHQGDVDKTLSVMAETSKLIGKSVYGFRLINKSKFEDTLVVDEMKVDQKRMSPKFRRDNVLDDKMYKMHMAKKKIVDDEPTFVKFVVLNKAKQ